MGVRRHAIILLLAALWLAPAARADNAERMTVARQDYAYDPRTRIVTLDLGTVYTGQDADMFRSLYARIGPDGYSRAKLDYYRTMYDAIAEAAPPAIKDDRAHNVIEARERYTVTLAQSDDEEPAHRFAIYPDLLRGFFSQLPATIQQPYALDGTLDRRDIVTVTAPMLGTYEVRDSGVSNPAFSFTRKAITAPGRVGLDYRLRFLTDRVAVADFEQYRADIARMDNNVFAWIDLDRDVYRRYYRDMPKIIRGVAAAVLLGAALGWWFLRRRRP
jgi:hypothetical protein